MLTEYQNDLESLIKAFQLDDKEITESVKHELYNKWGNDIADNLESSAFFQSLNKKDIGGIYEKD